MLKLKPLLNITYFDIEYTYNHTYVVILSSSSLIELQLTVI